MLDWLVPPVCFVCGAVGLGAPCPACRPGGVHRPPHDIPGIAEVFTCGGYGGPVGVAVRRAKYQEDRALAAALARLGADALAPALIGAPIAAIVAVPSPPRRLWRRGFSLPALFAEALGARLRVPLRPVLRIRDGVRQATLTPLSRSRALAGRVRIVGPEVAGVWLIVDDVVTTGATAGACARELLGHGADRVWLASLCVARRPNPMTPVRNL